MKMKNKKAEQIAAKQKHKEQLRVKRRIEPNLERPVAELIEKPSILIVCEGENTEPSYFNQFRLSSATVKSVGEGYNTTSLVNRAIQLANEKQYDQVWCVFDKDDFDENDFNNAIQIAEGQNFKVAYSNQSFEYWLILHFDDHQGGGMHRRDYNDKINELLKPFGVTYDGNGSKKVSEDFFELLDGIDTKTNKKRIDLAITRATRNFDHFDHKNPAKEESSTTVFRLAEELLQYL
ncbi:MAG: RloB domain-containing protein [Chitinophagaceae bacterium]|nr:RloB domain-containing protein [Chitinophagaceae bacterium]